MKTKHKIKLKDQNKIMNQSNKSEHDDPKFMTKSSREGNFSLF